MERLAFDPGHGMGRAALVQYHNGIPFLIRSVWHECGFCVAEMKPVLALPAALGAILRRQECQ